jgi:inosine/xanthosine triphosphate pyrophosphatase family protein
MAKRIRIAYVTSSTFKKQENAEFAKVCYLNDGTLVGDAFEFDLRSTEIKEILEVDLATMVQAEVISAYSQLKVPCIVEHAGLIFEDFLGQSYPGGLTKPMWNALGDRFVAETKSANRGAIARAVVAYCDGQSVTTFVGERKGLIADGPRGSRNFYWDTVFIPDRDDGTRGDKTYAEIVDDSSLGLAHKMKISQSSSAMLKFLEHRRNTALPSLWSGVAP